MKTAATMVISAAALTLAGCGSKETTTVSTTENTATASIGNDAAPTTPAVSGGQAFANTMAASDAFEIESSRLALANSQSASIKKFAQKMIDAHTESTAKLKSAAGTMTPDPALTSDQQTNIDAMKSLTGKAFDQAYIAAQTEGHQKALDTLRAYSSDGDVPALKSLATSLTPTVTAHFNMAKSLKA